MEALRHWNVRHARGLKFVYDACSRYSHHLAPVLRWVGSARAERVITPIERATKQLLFDCKMCGQCVLSSTGMACPTNCGKRMRNGPCGGVSSAGMCEIVPTMRCVWVDATEGRKKIVGGGIPGGMVLPPVDNRRDGQSSWIQMISGGLPKPVTDPADAAPPEREIHDFERACRSGRFVVTVELAPPDSADPHAFIERASGFKGLTDAINITDGAGGNCHMSSVAASAVLTKNGLTPVWQIACRDRNRIAIQGELLGAAALGIQNVLCLTGDDVGKGDQPQARPVFDLDAVSLLRIARNMRDRATFASGRKLDVPPNLFLGATINPFVPPYLDRISNLEMKVEAGAQFIQTQFCFDVEPFIKFMREVRARELHKRCAIIVGVGTLSTAKALRRMAEYVPGISIPEAVTSRIARAPDQRAEGKKILIETIRRLTEIEGVAGVHLMGYKNERVLAEVIVEAGLRQTDAAKLMSA
jgi:methylenetetrahydrofolate reductase (NADPH)